MDGMSLGDGGWLQLPGGGSLKVVMPASDTMVGEPCYLGEYHQGK